MSRAIAVGAVAAAERAPNPPHAAADQVEALVGAPGVEARVATAEPGAPVPFVTSISRHVERVFALLGAAAIVGLVLTIFANVARRVLTGQSFTWSDSVDSFLLAWSIFLAAPVCIRKRANPAFGLIRDRLKGGKRSALDFVAAIIQVSALASVASLGVTSALQLAGQNDPATGWSLGWVEIIMPISAVGMLWFVGANLSEEVAERRGPVVGALAAGLATVVGVLLGFALHHVKASPTVILVLTLVLLLFMGVPIALTLIECAFVALAAVGGIPLQVIVQRMFDGVNSSLLTAVPSFMLAGALMAEGGIAPRITDFVSIFVGRLRGGLAVTDVFASAIFADMSGSAVADTSAIGSVMIPAMVQRGYSPRWSAGVQAAAGSLGMMFPPSITMIIYAYVANVSVGRLFLASLLPGLVVVASYAAVVVVTARIKNLPKEDVTLTPSTVISGLRRSIFPLLAPVVILGGIFSGAFSPSEAGVIGVMYAIVIGFAVCKKRGYSWLLRSLQDTVIGSARVMFIVAGAIALSWVLATMLLPQSVISSVSGLAHHRLELLLVLMLVLVLLHTFLEASSTILLVVPIMLPLLLSSRVDPVNFGVLLVMNSALGYLLPPIGLLLFVVSKTAGVRVEKVAVSVLPMVAALVVDIVIVAIFPQISSVIPNLIGR